MLTEGKVEMFGRGGHPKMGSSGAVRDPFIICESSSAKDHSALFLLKCLIQAFQAFPRLKNAS